MALLVDGAFLEGGGQILRNAASLSSLMGTSINVNNIRAGRSKPGLRPQHLSGLRFLANLSQGQLQNDHEGSTDVTYEPGSIQSGSFVADTHTAGSVGLLLQAALPCLVFAKGATNLVLKGGTNADMAPQIDYMTMVLQPILKKAFGIEFDCNILRRGYFPKGGGEVHIASSPLPCLPPINLTKKGEVTKITGRAFVAGALPVRVAQIMADEAKKLLRALHSDVPCKIEVVKEQSAIGTGTGIIIVAETSTGCILGGSALGKRGVPAEQVGQNAAQELLKNLSEGGCVDEYLQDQLIIFMALADGKSEILCGQVTQHTQTAIYVSELLTKAKFSILEQADGTNVIQCQGIGLKNSQM